jgi:hypothetical protein
MNSAQVASKVEGTFDMQFEFAILPVAPYPLVSAIPTCNGSVGD